MKMKKLLLLVLVWLPLSPVSNSISASRPQLTTDDPDDDDDILDVLKYRSHPTSSERGSWS